MLILRNNRTRSEAKRIPGSVPHNSFIIILLTRIRNAKSVMIRQPQENSFRSNRNYAIIVMMITIPNFVLCMGRSGEDSVHHVIPRISQRIRNCSCTPVRSCVFSVMIHVIFLIIKHIKKSESLIARNVIIRTAVIKNTF